MRAAVIRYSLAFTFILFVQNALACAAITQKGTVCKRAASPGSAYCWQHGGTTKAERERAGLEALRQKVEPAPEPEKPKKTQSTPETKSEVEKSVEKKATDKPQKAGPTEDEIQAVLAAKFNAAALYKLKDGTQIKAQREVDAGDEYVLQDFGNKWYNIKKADVLETIRPKTSK